MDIQALKDYIIENDMTVQILNELGCHHIKEHKDRYSCCNPDGDNPSAINVFKENLRVIDYTRDLSDVSSTPDIFSLVEFTKEINFFKALQFVCESIGISVYKDFDEDLPESILITRMLLQMIDEDSYTEKEKPLKPINENVLSYYHKCVNDLFYNDGISYEIQQMFEIGYDDASNRITIPIRNWDGTLVGVKGRLFSKEIGENESKYIYLEPCNKAQILYGLFVSQDFIKEENVCYVGESEKFVLQLFSYGNMNCVSTGGKTISTTQFEMLSRMCADIVLCFDKDVTLDEIRSIAEKFIGNVNVYAIIDKENILEEHESPSDNKEKWNILKSKFKYKIR